VLSVICDQPHHGTSFSAVRFRQHGRWAAGGSVIVELRSGQHTKVELHTTTGPHGWFALRRTLHSGPWIAGSSYTWTTIIQGKTWATARRGTVTLTGNC
jgi:hypothetical protein